MERLSDDRTRVAHVITMLELGGAQQNTLHTVRHLDRRRYRVSLLVGPGGMLDDEARRIADLDLRFVPALARPVRPIADLRALGSLVRELRQLGPEIVHTHSSKAGILGRLAARRAGVPIVVHSIHGYGFTPAQAGPVRAAFVAAERVVATATTHFVTVSRANLTEGVRRGLFARHQATLIRSGFPLAAFRDAPVDRDGVRREFDLPPGCPLVVTVSCLKPQKDPATLATAAARVLGVRPDARFVVAGDGELRADLEARLATLGIAGAVRLAGWRDDVPRLLKASDLLLHTSRWEGLPRVIPQAMAAGLPVVATAVDGAPEAVREGEAGILAAPRDAAALAAGVVELLADRQRRDRLGRRGRQLAAEFDDVHLVPAQERLYDRLLASRRAASRSAA